MTKKLDKICSKLDSEDKGYLWKVQDGQIVAGYTDESQVAYSVRNELNEFFGANYFSVYENFD